MAAALLPDPLWELVEPFLPIPPGRPQGGWAREAFLRLPRVRIFLIDGLRTATRSLGHAGVNEVKLRHGRIVREGLRTTLTELPGRAPALLASAGIPFVDLGLSSSSAVSGGSSATSGGMRTGTPDAGDTKGSSSIATRAARSIWVRIG